MFEICLFFKHKTNF